MNDDDNPYRLPQKPWKVGDYIGDTYRKRREQQRQRQKKKKDYYISDFNHEDHDEWFEG